jgi:hypothetical protein
VVSGLYGIQTWDVSDPANPVLVQVTPVDSAAVQEIEVTLGQLLAEAAGVS